MEKRAKHWRPEGYAERAASAFRAAQPDGNQAAFAARHGFKDYQVSRWLRGCPAEQEELERWATALGVRWEFLIVGDAISENPTLREPKKKEIVSRIKKRSGGGVGGRGAQS